MFASHMTFLGSRRRIRVGAKKVTIHPVPGRRGIDTTAVITQVLAEFYEGDVHKAREIVAMILRGEDPDINDEIRREIAGIAGERKVKPANE